MAIADKISVKVAYASSKGRIILQVNLCSLVERILPDTEQ